MSKVLTGLRRSTPARVGVVVLTLALATAIYAQLPQRGALPNSDMATLSLQAQDLWHGNVMFRGWSFLLDPFVTIDVPFFALAEPFTGVGPSQLYVATGLILALTVGVAVAVAGDSLRGRRRAVAWGIVVMFLGLPVNEAMFFLGHAALHVGSMLFCLSAFWLLRRPQPPLWATSLAAGLLALGQVGDLQVLIFGSVPAAAAGVYLMFATRSTRAGWRHLAVATAAAATASAIGVVLHLAGGYSVGRGNVPATGGQMLTNVAHLPERLSAIFGGPSDYRTYFVAAFPHVSSISEPAYATAARLILSAIACAAVLLVAVRLLRKLGASRLGGVTDPRLGSTRESVIEVMLVGVCVVDVVFWVYANQTTGEFSFDRYLTPFLIASSVLTARIAARLRLRRLGRARCAALVGIVGVVATLSVAGFVHDLVLPRAGFPNSSLADQLSAQGLTLGVGDYWNANITTVASSGLVVVRPVDGAPHGRLRARRQLAKLDWYRARFQFVLIDPRSGIGSVNENAAIATFGHPSSVEWLSGKLVMVYARGLTVPLR